MAENEVVRTIRVRGVPEGLDNLTAQLRRAEQAYSGVSTAASSAAAGTETSARRLNTTERAYRSLTERLDSTARVYRQLQTDTRTLSGAFDAGFLGKGAEAAVRFNRELLQVRQTLQDIGGARATGSPALEQTLGLRTGGQGAARESAAAFEEQTKNIQRLRQQYDPLGVAQERYASAVAESNALLRTGMLTEAQHVTITTNARKVLEDTTKAYNGAFVAQGKYTTGAGLARHELVNLSRQVQDVGVSLASGQSPFTVLIQQGTQIADVFASSRASVGGFLTQALGGIGRFAASGAGVLTGGALISAGAIASALRYSEAQTEIEKALAGVGRASGATREAINRQAEAEAAAARVSVASAREILSAYAATGRTNPGALPGLTQFTANYAAQTGIATADAGQKLAKIFADPAKGALELQQELGGLSDVTLRYIRDMQAAGDRTAAARALLDVFSKSVEGATDRGNFFAQTWRNIGNAVSNASDAVGKFVSGGASAQERLDELRRQRDQRARFGGTGVAERDAEIKRLEAIVELERQRNEIVARRAKAENASVAAGEIVESLNPYVKALRDIQEQRSKLEEAIKLNPGTEGLDEWRRWSEALDQAGKTLLTTLDRQQRTNALNVQAAQARTLAERSAVEVARLTLDLAGKTVDAKEREAIIQGKIAELQAQANREARDALRNASDQAQLAGLRPYERQLREIEFRERDNRERFGGSAGSALPASAAAANGLDNAFAASLKAMAAAIPGITITSGYRSYEQQAKLYAEKPNLAAPPGRSQHEKGMAADIAYNGSGNIPAWVRERASEFGLTFPLANRARNPEPWHVEPIGGRNGGAAGDAAASTIAGLERSAAATEAYNSVIRTANDNLAAQQAQLKATRDTMFMSTEEVAKAQKTQELYNQAVQQGGVGLANALMPEIERTAAAYGALARQQEELQRMQESLKTVGDLGRSVLSGIYSDLRNGASGADILRNALDKIASKLMDMALNDLFGKAFGNNAMGLFGNGGFFGSLFGAFSGGSSLGTTPGAGGLYASGGYTGPGGKYDAAGIVHRGEYVFSAASVNRIGLGRLDAMHRGGLPGYAGGGYVAPTPYNHAAAANSNGAKVNVQVVNRTTGEVEGTASAKQNSDGSFDVMVDLFEARMADKAVHGQGSLATAQRAIGAGHHLRG